MVSPSFCLSVLRCRPDPLERVFMSDLHKWFIAKVRNFVVIIKHERV